MIRVPLAPMPGLITEETAFSVPNACIDANCVRWRNGRPEPIGGWKKHFTSQLDGVCRNLMTWADLDSRVNIALGTNTKLYVHVGGSLADITPAGLAAGSVDSAVAGSWGAGDWGDGYWGEGSLSSTFPRTWSFDNWGQNLVANPRGGTIYLWENVTTDAAAGISNAPAEVNSILVTPERQILAFGCSEEVSGVFNPLAVRGCASEDLEDWTTAADNNVFEDILSGAGSRLVNAAMVGNYVAAWTDEGLFMGQFVGAVEQTYQWDLQGTNCGLIAPNAATIVNKRAFWLTPDLQFYTWAPGEAPAPIPCPVRSVLDDNLVRAQQDKIASCSIGQYGEVWWFYPDERDGAECSRYVSLTTAVPYGQGYQWSQGELARTAAIDAGTVKQPLMVTVDGYVYSHEDGQTAAGAPLVGSYTVSLPYLEEGGRFVLVKGLEPDFLDQEGAVSFSFVMRKYPQDEGYSKGPYALAPGANRKHFMFQGRSGEVTVSWNSSPAFHRLGKPVLLAEITSSE